MNNKSINQKAHFFCALLKKIPIAMRITLVLIFVFAFQLQAELTYSQNTKISLELKNSTVEKVLQTIEEKSDYYFLYNNQLINVDRKVSIRVKDATIAAVLQRLFKSENVDYEVKDSQIMLFPKEMYSQITAVAEALQQQGKTVTGTIVDANGDPVIGATIVIQGDAAKGTVTDIDGNYTLTNVPDNATLHISYVGMKPQSISTSGRTTINITMMEDTELLDEVVVVGFGSQRKTDLTGAISQVKMEDVLGDRPVISASAALQGAIPGLMVGGASSPGQAKTFNIRGTLSINGGSPLVLIDNVEGDINALNPDDIESVSVLKDASSAAIYGARGAGGVILITTKRPKGVTKFQLNYSFSQGWENAVTRPVQASLEDYISAYEEAGYSNQYWAGDGNLATWKELLSQYKGGTLQGVYDNGIYKHTDGRIYYLKEGDVQGNALSTGLLSNHNVSLSGGTEKLRFRISGNLSSEDGPMITNKDKFNRNALTSFVSADITDWYTQELTMYYTDTKSTGLIGNIRDPFATRLISWYPEGYMPKEIIGTEKDLIIDSPKNSYLISPIFTSNSNRICFYNTILRL